MTQETRVLYTTTPTRDARWWLRTAVYLAVLLSQALPQADDARSLLAWVVAVVPVAVAVFFRDRYPWVVAALSLALTVLVAEVPIAIGMAVLASRSRIGLTVAYAVAGVLALIVPWSKWVSSGITFTPEPTGLAGIAVQAVVLVVLPGMVGLLRRGNREARQIRLRHEAEQRELAAEQAVVEERNRIAQEMHDVLGHKLSLISLQAGALEVNAGGDPTVVAEQAQLIRTSSRQAMAELRSILGVLGESATDARHPQPGLAEAMELVDRHRASGARIALRNELADDLVIPATVQMAIHRVVQEGLTNVLRHAPGAATEVALSRPQPGTVRLDVVNGPPAQPGAGPGTGRGLPGMTERVRSLGGRLEAARTDAGGYRLCATIPLPTEGE